MYYSSFDMSSILSDFIAAGFSYGVCQSLMQLILLLYRKGLLDVNQVRKFIHISMGLIVMLCWPMFSCGWRGRIVAGFIPSLCMMAKVLIVAYKLHENEELLRRRYKNYRELLKATLCYILTIAFVTIFHWRTPTAVAAICNLCAGDGMADIVGRRFGSRKLPYNENKSFAGSIGMAIAGFIASILYMYYFSWLGYIQESHPNTVLGFLVVSVASALVESHRFSSKLDDNLTVPLASILIGTYVL